MVQNEPNFIKNGVGPGEGPKLSKTNQIGQKIVLNIVQNVLNLTNNGLVGPGEAPKMVQNGPNLTKNGLRPVEDRK